MRALMLWVLVRALYFAVAVMAGAGGAGDPLAPNPLWVLVVCTLLFFADVRRRGEHALWGNLGISKTQLALLCAAVCIAGETLVTVARR